MAAILMEENHLLTLKISLRYWSTPAEIVLNLVRLDDGLGAVDTSWTISAGQLGLPDDVDGVCELASRFPDDVFNAVATTATALLRPNEPLWLLFEGPYGVLGALDWEGHLRKRIGRPVLRLPDFIEPPRASYSRVRVALICDLPMDDAPFPVGETVASIAATLLGLAGGNTQVEVFVSGRWRAEVAHAIDRRPNGGRLSMARVPDENDLGWLELVERRTSGGRVDAVQFLCPGWFSGQLPVLALTESPSLKRSAQSSVFLTPKDVSTFLKRIGAWAVIFSSPPYNGSAPVRAFADAVAQIRPGPALYHDAEGAASMGALRDWLEFLFHPEPSRPPFADGFAYCQPALVLGHARRDPRISQLGLEDFADAFANVREDWVSSALEFSKAADLRRYEARDTSTSAARQAYAATVDRLNSIVLNYASQAGTRSAAPQPLADAEEAGKPVEIPDLSSLLKGQT